MRLLYSRPSPYSSKCRMAARHCALDLHLVATDTGAEGDDLVGHNPIGKIPVLVLDDGPAIYDSRVICDYFDRLSGNLLIPQQTDAWLRTKRIEALADGMAEAAMATLYEVRFRPEEKRHQPWVNKQWRRAHRALDALERAVADLPEAPNLAHYAIVSDLGWLLLRYPDALSGRHDTLADWLKRFADKHPHVMELAPQA